MKKEITKTGANEYSVVIEIPVDQVTIEIEKVTAEFGQSVTLPGFRKGKAPSDLVKQAVGEAKIKDEAAKRLIGPNLLQVLKEENIVPLIDPSIDPFDLNFEKPFTFTTKITTYPEVKLGDYQKLKVKKPVEKTVTAEEITKVVEQLYQQVENPVARDNFMFDAKGEKISLGDKKEVVPDDSFAQKVGATSLEDLKEKIKTNLEAEAKYNHERDLETVILEELVKKTKVTIPDSLIQVETENIIKKIAYDLSSMGSSFESYLEGQKKTIEDLKKEYRDSAVKTILAQFALNELSKKEDLRITEEEVLAALPKGEENHEHTATEKAQMHAWLMQRKALEWLKAKIN